MQDHVLALNAGLADAIAADWYKVHRLLHDQIGYRVLGMGDGQTSRWLFGADPRAVMHEPEAHARFIFVRTLPELSGAIAPLSVHSCDTFIPRQGETVRFFLNVSTKRSASFDFRTFVLSQEPRSGETREQAAWRVIASDFVTNSGLDLVGDLDATHQRRFEISKMDKRRTEKVTKHAIFASGCATVTDAAKVRRAVLEGIGRDRGFGFGLLVLEPMTGGQA
jgi:hypothetical protein